ncbi:hypothetical protein HYR54_07035 [Candidatus Acetothermia bacterium]|nr:hypothetical protein [Candidatus Acetothermia bacterium]MBI3658851.1 hypothetical protein [Candidatus Acetothermia bacterium]
MKSIRGWRGCVPVLVGLICVGLFVPGGTQAQMGGPLAKFKDNVHQLHIVARYLATLPNGSVGQSNIVQTVTAIAVRSQPGQTYWLIEKDHVDPQFYYRERRVSQGTAISFIFFVDNFDIVALIQGGSGDPIEVFKVTDHYAVLRDTRGRAVPDAVIATDPQENESAVIALPQGGGVARLPTFRETETQIVQAPADAALFYIKFAQKDDELTHGAPVFVQRDGEWRLVGIRVVHGRATQPDQSAVAKLPPLEELVTKQ